MSEFKPYIDDRFLILNDIESPNPIAIWRMIVPNIELYIPKWNDEPEECNSSDLCQPLWGITPEGKFITYCIGCRSWEEGHYYEQES